ncbi:hypothetical protein [Nocardia sp. NBC_00403]|uniref:hypothetical protein n=1 Tax=Nocardia sp. NBC_00403 TaxID=2975990 RepID=UPI002E24F2DC
MSHAAAQYAALANRLSTYLQKYVQEVRAEAGHLIDSAVREKPRQLLEGDAAGAEPIRAAMRAENGTARNSVAVPDADTGAGAWAPQLPEGKHPIFPDQQKIAEIVRGARAQSGNFGVGRASRAEADAAGLAWVGVDARKLPYGDTHRLISKDGLLHYRPPQQKPSGRGVQANYEWRSDPNRHWEGNAHLDIEEL